MTPPVIKNLVKQALAAVLPGDLKGQEEYRYWKTRLEESNGVLDNSHYQPLYTELFGLSRTDYEGKRVLDIGCGPRGSLEWADMTAQRVGLDPLVPQYLKLGADKHKMEYCAAPSEHIPYADGYFDIVACLNALDHVNDFQQTVREIKRVVKKGGRFLLTVEINQPPTATEPITMKEEMLQLFEPEFELQSSFKVGTPPDHDLHRAARTRTPEHVPGQPGVFVALYHRK
jgi:ubiquinone/menaquinone biosynthesis C-methylase UbiE